MYTPPLASKYFCDNDKWNLYQSLATAKVVTPFLAKTLLYVMKRHHAKG
jgi:hypothetical protein